jgi:hypothetical protein
MPFYHRTRARRPLWQPALLGTLVLLVWTAARVVFAVRGAAEPRPGALSAMLYVVGYAIVGGLLAGGWYWALGLAPLKGSTLIRSVAGTGCVASCLAVLALAASQFGARPPLEQVSRPAFVLSTLLVSAIFGGLFGTGLLSRSGDAERVYLTPAEFTALSAAEQARLRPASDAASSPSDTTGGV